MSSLLLASRDRRSRLDFGRIRPSDRHRPSSCDSRIPDLCDSLSLGRKCRADSLCARPDCLRWIRDGRSESGKLHFRYSRDRCRDNCGCVHDLGSLYVDCWGIGRALGQFCFASEPGFEGLRAFDSFAEVLDWD